MRKFPLKRRDVTRLLTANGFRLERTHGSHYRYEGILDGVTRRPEVDQGIDEFVPDLHRPLGGILAQLGFFDDDYAVSHDVAWERFYAGERTIARRAQVRFRKWDDPYWRRWYSSGVR